MFALHETTQRHVCRAIFLLACVLPTLATVAWIAYVHRPWREHDWQRMLTDELHVRAQLGTITNPRPGVTQLAQVRLCDLRSQRLLVALQDVTVRRRHSGIAIRAGHLESQVQQLPALAAAIGTWLSTEDAPAIELRVERATVAGSSTEVWQLDDLRVLSDSAGDHVQQLNMEAAPVRHAVGGQAALLKLTATCQRVAEEVALRITFDTTTVPVPTWLVRDVIPGIGSCRGATFAGLLQWVDQADQRHGSYSGRVGQIDLRQLLNSNSPHRLEGRAIVELERLTWQDGRLQVAIGQLRAERGAVSRSLLDELVKRLYCVIPSPAAAEQLPAAEPISFDELACRFRLSTAGLALEGDCRSDVDGCLLMSQGTPLLLQPPSQIPWLAQLVQVFHLPAGSWLPATQEAHAMSGLLPLPSTKGDAASRSIGRR